MTLMDNVYTFENVTIDASASYDVDMGDVTAISKFKTELERSTLILQVVQPVGTG